MARTAAARANILTWNVHASYLHMLVGTGQNFYVPRKQRRPYYYDGLTPGYAWPATVHEVATADIRHQPVDLILFQTLENIYKIGAKDLSPALRDKPKILLLHVTPPLRALKPTEVAAINSVDAIVHVTTYNAAAWKAKLPPALQQKPVIIIHHGIPIDESMDWQGDRARAVTAINLFARRPEQGYRHWKHVTRQVACDLFGEDSEALGGKGFLSSDDLKKEFARYRLYYNPTWRSSLPMVVLEAMSVGLPVVTRSTTELPNVIHNGRNGFISNNPQFLVQKIKLLLGDKSLAETIGQQAQQTIRDEFSPQVFRTKWNQVFANMLHLV